MKMKLLNEEQKHWFISNYPIMLTVDVAEHLGLTLRQTQGCAKRLGVKKEHFIIEETGRLNSNQGYERAMKDPNRKNWRFVKNVSNIERFGEEIERNRLLKSGETMRKVFKSEMRRVLFGLPQRTNIKLGSGGKKRVKMRMRLRKLGYQVGLGSNIAYITPETKRNLKYEKEFSEITFRVL